MALDAPTEFQRASGALDHLASGRSKDYSASSTAMSIHDPLSFLVLGVILWGIVKQLRSDRSLNLDPEKFWSLVRSQEKPVVLLATKGWLIKRLVYVLPYQGILFMTEARYTEAPDGVKLIGAGEAFNIP